MARRHSTHQYERQSDWSEQFDSARLVQEEHAAPRKDAHDRDRSPDRVQRPQDREDDRVIASERDESRVCLAGRRTDLREEGAALGRRNGVMQERGVCARASKAQESASRLLSKEKRVGRTSGLYHGDGKCRVVGCDRDILAVHLQEESRSGQAQSTTSRRRSTRRRTIFAPLW